MSQAMRKNSLFREKIRAFAAQSKSAICEIGCNFVSSSEIFQFFLEQFRGDG